MQHISGPWKVSRDERGRCFINADGEAKMFVCTLDALVGALHEANASLIAAATDMLAALKDAESCFNAMADEGYLNEHRRAVWASMRTAIQKAHG